MRFSRLYTTLLRLYPQDYRLAFEAEMLAAFERSAQEHSRAGGFSRLRFLFVELAGLAGGIAREWAVRANTDPSIRARSLPAAPMMGRGVRSSVPDALLEAEQRVQFCLRRMEHAIANHDFPGARYYAGEDQKAREQLQQMRRKYLAG